VVVLPPVEVMGAANVVVAEEGEDMVRTVTMAAKMLMGFREDTVLEGVAELAAKKAPRIERGALVHPTVAVAEVVGVDTVMVNLVMILRGHLGGPMNAIAVLAVGLK
jgi:hypothetical protein